MDQSGNKSSISVPAEGLLFARQVTAGGPSVIWTQRDPLGITEIGRAVYDPLGNYIPFQQQADPRPPAGSFSSGSMSGPASSLADPNNYGMGCLMDGMPTSCNRVMQAIHQGQGQRLIYASMGIPEVQLVNLGFIPVKLPSWLEDFAKQVKNLGDCHC